MTLRVAVVGGGLAGLAAALECADAGADVTLYEARPRLGGATFSVQRKGLWLDNGQHVFLRCCTAYIDFLRRLGVERLVTLQPRLRIPVLREGAAPVMLRRDALPAPLHLARTLLGYGLLRPRQRLNVIRAATTLRRLRLGDPALDGQSFGDWLQGHGQDAAAVSYLWDLIALPTLNLPAAEASLAMAVKVFRTGLLDSSSACDIGMSAVPLQRLHGEAAAIALASAGARVALGAPVRSIRPVGDELRLQLDDAVAEADAVVSAVPHHALGRIAPGAADQEALDTLGWSPIVNLHVHYDRTVLHEPFAAAVDSPLQWLFDRTRSSGTADGQLVTVSLSAAEDELGAPLAALEERYLPALARLLPDAGRANVLDFAATREPRATFRAAPGTQPARPGPRTRVRGLYLAGAWTDTGWPATMEGAVRSGATAARALLADRQALRDAADRRVPSGAGAGSR
ncbi:MAG: hydroxysqualene dehydroxylase HpnE [Gaiellaceae bacterium]